MNSPEAGIRLWPRYPRGPYNRSPINQRRSGRQAVQVEEQFYDVLQNIEASIVALYEAQPNLLDCEVQDALEALSRRYKWEQEARGTPKARLFGRSPQVFDSVARICEWRLGRGTLHGEKSSETDSLAPSPFLSLEEVVLCLQRIRSSVRLWNNEGGRQGYLRYVSQFLSDAERMAGNG